MSSRSFLSMSYHFHFFISLSSCHRALSSRILLRQCLSYLRDDPSYFLGFLIEFFSLRSLRVKLRPHDSLSPAFIVMNVATASGMAGSLSRYSIVFPLHTPVLGMATAASSFSRYHPRSSAICAVVAAVRRCRPKSLAWLLKAMSARRPTLPHGV